MGKYTDIKITDREFDVFSIGHETSKDRFIVFRFGLRRRITMSSRFAGSSTIKSRDKKSRVRKYICNQLNLGAFIPNIDCTT
jgi:hypothetical protein